MRDAPIVVAALRTRHTLRGASPSLPGEYN